MSNPRVQSRLIETPSPAAQSDAPKTGIVWVVGTAGSGPIEPMEFENASDAYRVYGTEGDLARTIELALLGANYGARVAGNNAIGRVIGLRTETGTRASVTLKDAEDRTVMRLETTESSNRANNWKVYQKTSGNELSGYRVVDPTTNTTTDFSVDPHGVGGTNRAASVSELAEAIRGVFQGRLNVEIEEEQAHFEIKVTSNTDDVIINSASGRTSLDLSELAVADLAAIKSGDTTWIDNKPAYFDGNDPVDAHLRILAKDNDEARFYAITAGGPVAISKGIREGVIDHLADSKRVGAGKVGSLLNIRTTGEGQVSDVKLEDASQRKGDKVSEGYYRVRRAPIGRFDPSVQDTNGDNYVIKIAAPYGISDDGGAVSIAYAATKSLDADEVSTDRLGKKPDKVFELFAQSITSTTMTPIPLAVGGASGITASLDWAGDVATLEIDKDEFDEAYGSAFDDAALYASYDTCIFDLTEVSTTTALNEGNESLQFAVSGNTITFNRELEHELVVRPLRVTQYRLGSDVIVDRSTGRNVFTFYGEGKQPGEGGGSINSMEVIFGFDYKFEPDFPNVAQGGVSFSGGSSGANASPEAKLRALEEALIEFKDQEFQVLVPAGIYLDDKKQSFDPVTGTASYEAVGLLDVLQAHQDRVSSGGAPGIVYCSVKPMKPSSASGRYSDIQIFERFLELTEVDGFDKTRPATALNGKSYPDFFFFDAPMAVTTGGVTTRIDGAPFFAGLRAALPNDRALYQIELPSQVAPLYRYNSSSIYMPGRLADARINVWSNRRGETRLADERTGAGLVPNSRGVLEPSSFQSGHALLAAKEFLQKSVAYLQNLLGPLPAGGVDVLIGNVETQLRSLASGTVGVQDIDINHSHSIRIRSEGGSALGMYITAFLRVNGELRTIEINVGTMTTATPGSGSSSTIPVAG